MTYDFVSYLENQSFGIRWTIFGRNIFIYLNIYKMNKTLFAVYLWWKHDNWFIEDHDLVFVIAENKDEAKKIAKQKTRIKEDLHCDWIVEVKNVDWFSINVIKTDEIENVIYDNQYQKI